MPFIDSKITIPVTAEKREIIKSKLGEAVSFINKPESYLMVGFEDNYDLYLGGRKLERGAFVSVSLFGGASSAAYRRMTSEISKIYEKELNIPKNAIYITYQGISDWGFDGKNF